MNPVKMYRGAHDVNWDLKRKKWKDQEVIAMLNLIKKHNLLEHNPTDSQLGETLLKPMNELGYTRNAHQIKLKVKSLRKKYALCKSGNLDSFKNFVYYPQLDALYSQMDSNDLDSEEESNEIETDSMIWTESGLDNLLQIIKQLNLSHELCIGNVSINLLRKIHKALLKFNTNKTLDQIKTLLQNLKNTYANCKKKLSEDSTLKIEFPYFNQLDDIWREEYESGYFHTDDGFDEFWSEEETILLLEALKDTNSDFILDEAAKIDKVEEYLKDSGYKRTRIQILQRIGNLKQNYFAAKKCKTLNDAIAIFPFYHRCEQVFMREDKTENFVEEQEDNSFNMEDVSEEGDNLIDSEKKKTTRGFIWVEEETLILLNLVKELNLIRVFCGRMKLESVARLVAPLAALGYERTAWQIKLKLKSLRNQYYRYIKTKSDVTEKCPYFDKINEIVQKLNTNKAPKSNELIPPKTLKKKRETILKDITVDEDDQNFNRELIESSVFTSDSLDTPNNQIFLWESLETIPDQDTLEDKSDRLSDMFEEVFEDEGNDFEINNADKNQTLETSEHENNCVQFAESVKVAARDQSLCPIKNGSLSNTKVNDALLSDKTLESLATRDNDAAISQSVCSQLLESCSSKLDRSSIKDTAQASSQIDLGSGSLSTNDVLVQVLKHEEMLQQQHHQWLENHFEKQRKHDSEMRKELLNELQLLRSAILSGKTQLN